MGLELLLGFAAGIATPPAAKKAKEKIKPWLSKKLKSLRAGTED